MIIRPVSISSINFQGVKDALPDLFLDGTLSGFISEFGLKAVTASIILVDDENDAIIHMTSILRTRILSKWTALLTGDLEEWKTAVIALLSKRGKFNKYGCAFYILFDQAGLRNTMFSSYTKEENQEGVFILKPIK